MAIADDDYTYTPRDTSRGYTWLQIRTSLLDDPKYMQLPDQAKAVYFEVYLLAGRSDAGGLILAGDDSANVTDIAYLLRRTDDDTEKALDLLQRAGLVDLDGYTVTVCRFASEQGPSQAEKRREWAIRQQNKRERAKAKNAGTEQNQNSESDAKKEKNQNPEKELKADQNKTKTKSVTRRSRENHAIITRDTIDDDVLTFGNDVLSVWKQLHGFDYEPPQKFWQMIFDWQNAGVMIQHARQALIQTQATAETPMYARDLAMTIRERDPKIQADKNLDQFRRLYLAQKHTDDDTDGDQ